MDNNSKIYIAGHNGLVGSAIKRTLLNQGFNNLLLKSSKELDLRNQTAVLDFFKKHKPEYVFLAAAKVGGIVANNTYRADFIYENLQIQNNIIHSAYKFGVKKLLFLGSSCIYPKNAPQPMKEEHLLTSTLEYTNEPYAIAKIAGIKLCESFNLQYNTNFLSVMPTNLYGPNDNYDLEKSHVLPALIRKFHLAQLLETDNREEIRKDLNRLPIEKVTGSSDWADILKKLAQFGIKKNNSEVSVTLWGSGKPMREFLYVDDMADACVFIMKNINFTDITQEREHEIRNTHINIGTGTDLTIAELAEKVKRSTGFTGLINWDKSKPDGTSRKLLDVSKLKEFGWTAKTHLDKGIDLNYSWYKNSE